MNSVDPYTQRAMEIFGVTEDQVTTDQRPFAKRQYYLEAYASKIPFLQQLSPPREPS